MTINDPLPRLTRRVIYGRIRAQFPLPSVAAELITLSFRPVDNQAPVLVRGTYFRICADGTLRGPDNSMTASFANGVWELAHRQHRAFDCGTPLFLRVTDSEGRRENRGPYDGVRAADGAIFTHDNCLGIFASGIRPSDPLDLWREVVLLSAV